MSKISNVKATLEDAAKAKAVWQSNPELKIGEIGLLEFTAVFQAAEGLSKDYTRESVALTGLRVNRDDKVGELNDLVTRFRSGIRAVYGPDSAQYEQAGGVRKSARKAPKSRVNTAVSNEKSA